MFHPNHNSTKQKHLEKNDPELKGSPKLLFRFSYERSTFLRDNFPPRQFGEVRRKSPTSILQSRRNRIDFQSTV